ncbi:hypothetical protein SDC9_104865 [bioreactor metagenome]|uniref:Uncharacterized protein n=1 Tax=bioreactor metagenome TaxID=1076179 RepID=A0A645AZ19_9ZZZZ
MEGQGQHRLHRVKVNGNHPVVIGPFAGGQGPVFPGPSVGLVKFLHRVVRLPDRGKAGRLRGHHVHAVAVVHGEGSNARPRKLQYPVADKALLKRGLDQRKGHVVRAYPRFRRAGEPDQNDFRIIAVPGVL